MPRRQESLSRQRFHGDFYIERPSRVRRRRYEHIRSGARVISGIRGIDSSRGRNERTRRAALTVASQLRDVVGRRFIELHHIGTGLRDLYDFATYNQSTQGHLNSDGLCAVERHYLPGSHALNFLLSGALDGGCTVSLSLDPFGKSAAQDALDMSIPVPASLQSLVSL